MHDQRRNQHRQHQRRQHRLRHERRHQPEVAISASRTKPNSPPAHSQRPVRIAVPGALPSRRDKPPATANLSSSIAARTAKHQQEIGQDQVHVEQHADGHEEQSHEHIAERLDVLFHLIAVFGFEISMPATKAPSASDRPAISVR